MTNKLPCFIQPNSGEPIYQQLVRQLKHAIATGSLEAGDQLPTVRELAEQLVINPNTVGRAYRELFAAGLVEGTQGAGTFVKARSRVMKTTERESRIQPFIDQLIAEATLLGFDKREIVRLVQRTLREREEELNDQDERSHQKIR